MGVEHQKVGRKLAGTPPEVLRSPYAKRRLLSISGAKH